MTEYELIQYFLSMLLGGTLLGITFIILFSWVKW